MPDSSSFDGEQQTPRDQPGSASLRVSATDHAILVAFCRPYMAGQRFASPAPNSRIVEELASNGIFLDLDTLRTHLRNLYAKFGVEEGLTPVEKRVRLVELVYDHGLISGWSEDKPPDRTPTTDEDEPPDSSRPIDEDESLDRRGAVIARLLSYPRRPWIAAGFAAVLIGLATVTITEPWSNARAPAPRVDSVIPGSSINDATGAVTYCTGEDVVVSQEGKTHQHEQAIEDFNNAFGTRLRAKLHQFGDEAGRQYAQFSRDQRERSGLCDVFYSDVIWTADFAHKNWLLDLSPYFGGRLKSFVPTMRDAAVFEGKMYGVPKQADAALLYYRKDRVEEPPETWQELYQQAAARPRLQRVRYQGSDYEGLTVAFLEIAYAAGADEIVTPEHKANLKQLPAYSALQLMVDGIGKTRAARREIVLQGENESIEAFGTGRLDFMRHWPYVYALLQDARTYPKVAGRVAVAPLPRWENEPTVSVLGGHVLVVSTSSKNPGGALTLVEYLTSRKIMKRDATDFSLAPALLELWDDPDVQSALPAFGDLKAAVFDAKTRPVTPNYQAVSAAISKNVNSALRGQIPVDEAIDTANDEMQQALDAAYP